MPKSALDYDTDFSEEGLRTALSHLRGIAISAEHGHRFLTRKEYLIYQAIEWDQERPDDADRAYLGAVTVFGREAVASRQVLRRAQTLASGGMSQPRDNYDALLGRPYDSPRRSSTDTTGDMESNDEIPQTNLHRSLPIAIKEEYAAKHEETSQIVMRVGGLRAELFDVQNRAESINYAEFRAWTDENDLGRLRIPD
ncbi:hypothetical protein IQ06DRAFT_301098 [Phaeosphaeriaceae sp. SRC1lsM3a]|nr:hypothetical protein IQ06DRAFT_301098 [Stagonospora sp. SRC1lsM3a]